MDDQDKIDAILTWAEENDHFDTEFVSRLQSRLDSHGLLTDKQSEALDNIIEKFGIEQ